jgi:predicted alpha/beta superfamily hydrolase
VSAYLARVQQEVLPWVAREYGASLAPRDLAFAGSSFGGVAALAAGRSAAGQQEGGAFGALLVESPSMWIADEAFLKVRGQGRSCCCCCLCVCMISWGTLDQVGMILLLSSVKACVCSDSTLVIRI